MRAARGMGVLATGASRAEGRRSLSGQISQRGVRATQISRPSRLTSFEKALVNATPGASPRELGEQGVAIESKVEWPRGGASLYFRDPDGHLVELITPGCWEVY